MHEGPELSTPTPIPPQRVPAHDGPPAASEPAHREPSEPVGAGQAPVGAGQASVEAGQAPVELAVVGSAPVEDAPVEPAPAEPAAAAVEPQVSSRGRRRRGRVLVAAGGALAVLVGGFVVWKPDSGPEAAAIAAPSAPAASDPAAPTTPYDQAVAVLDAQADALTRGDESAWLAAVDGKLRGKYRSIFRNLRGLGVLRVDYEPGVGQPVKGDATAVALRTDLVYCFSEEMCPRTPATEWEKAPRISQKLTLKPVAGKYVISGLAVSPQPDFHQPTPWESGDLVFAQGARVTVAADKGHAKYLRTVLPVAEKAAGVADRYAALNGTPQRRYRIFLAAEKQWKSWYGGENDRWAIGLAVPLNKRGIDVIVRMSEMDDALTLATTVQHELGHVVTLTGAYQMDAVEDTWLSEGIAEYIGWRPKAAAKSLRRYSVRWQLDRAAPKSMVPARPGPKAPARAGDAFYGLSHLAVDCMAHKYGETKLFTFVRLVLTEDNSLDQASQDAYGVPFATLDKACLPWIRQQVS
ncbi:hypothetical protein ACFQS1_12620 [Paractinoplanes rhizophilus]|uniref:Basic secretory peptidase family protein n=1 Tax=Paractinoplanes rhizophilus TaxID=1416877 RepID=A0ABW2HQI9_9ACTN